MHYNIKRKLRLAALRWALWYMNRRPADHVIETGYMSRWYVTPWRHWIYLSREDGGIAAIKGWIGRHFKHVYLHYYTGGDDARAVHDHPWPSRSLVLDGVLLEYFDAPPPEYEPRQQEVLTPGDWRYRPADFAHKLELCSDHAVTLFITGRKARTWGFWCPWKGFVPYHQYIGKGGCE